MVFGNLQTLGLKGFSSKGSPVFPLEVVHEKTLARESGQVDR
jgi:hypothetical protein